jgi:hypothetical protein
MMRDEQSLNYRPANSKHWTRCAERPSGCLQAADEKINRS